MSGREPAAPSGPAADPDLAPPEGGTGPSAGFDAPVDPPAPGSSPGGDGSDSDPSEADPAESTSATDPVDVDGPDGPAADVSVEALLDDIDALTRQRDDYLDALRRSQADFENYRKRMMKQQTELADHAAVRLVEDLLPVLDACDGAVLHGETAVEPIFAALLGTLEKGGLERIDPTDEPFDPTRHEAVMHEPAEGDDAGTVVADVMRRGYAWKGRVVRPAMVKVRG